jgi:hypothetical protein
MGLTDPFDLCACCKQWKSRNAVNTLQQIDSYVALDLLRLLHIRILLRNSCFISIAVIMIVLLLLLL